MPLPRALFKWPNRLLMVPLFRLGLGPLLGNPLSGYIMVLKTAGRKTGRLRSTPLNYAILDGAVYCAAGWGAAAHWYRNLAAQPRVECMLPHTSLAGVAETVTEPAERLRVLRLVLRNAGLAGFLAGLNPYTAPDAVVLERTRDCRVVRIRPIGPGSGPGDPGGWLWVPAVGGMAALVAWLAGVL